MTRADAPEFLAKLTALGELFDAKFSEMKQQLYFEALKDLDVRDLVEALATSARTCRFMPKPVELRHLVEGDDDTQADLAWSGWRQAARIGGAHCNLLVNIPLAETLQAVFGGWPSACRVELSPEMWASRRKEFGRLYTHFRRMHGPISPKTLLSGTTGDSAAAVCFDHGQVFLLSASDCARELGELTQVSAGVER